MLHLCRKRDVVSQRKPGEELLDCASTCSSSAEKFEVVRAFFQQCSHRCVCTLQWRTQGFNPFTPECFFCPSWYNCCHFALKAGGSRLHGKKKLILSQLLLCHLAPLLFFSHV